MCGSFGDVAGELGVIEPRETLGQLGREFSARLSARELPLFTLQGSSHPSGHFESQPLDLDAVGSESFDDLRCEQRQLLCPAGGCHVHEQHAGVQSCWPGHCRDLGSDASLPRLRIDGDVRVNRHGAVRLPQDGAERQWATRVLRARPSLAHRRFGVVSHDGEAARTNDSKTRRSALPARDSPRVAPQRRGGTGGG
jgi:hypothetical protein